MFSTETPSARSSKGKEHASSSSGTEPSRSGRATRKTAATSSTLTHRPGARSSQPNVVDAQNPDDRQGQPRRQDVPRPTSNSRGTAGPSQPRPADNPGPKTPTTKSPNALPKPPTEQPLTIRMHGKPAENLSPDLLGAVYRVINLALDVLEQECSLEKLIYIGATSVQDWGKRKNPREIIYPTTPCNDEKYRNKKPTSAEMGRLVQVFLQKIRHCFPPVDIRPIESGPHAMFRPSDWVQDARERCARARKQPSNENIMLGWDAMDSGVMRLDILTLTLVADLRSEYLKVKESGDKEATNRCVIDYHAFLVNFAFTVAHELVHCFVRFLSGDKRVGTPRSLMPKGYKDKPTRGESGRMWEELVFGGCTSYSLPQKKDDTLRLFMDKDNKKAQVDPAHINDIAQGKIRFPLKTVGKWERI